MESEYGKEEGTFWEIQGNQQLHKLSWSDWRPDYMVLKKLSDCLAG